MASWEAITSLSGVASLLVGGSVAYGKLRQRVTDMGKQVAANTVRLTKVEERANDGEGDRREIMAKLENLVDGQKEMRDLLLQHITKKDD